ncbi:hypothetical protein AB0L65_20670 [Nonomuraea sp. NPDC052116]|uniref:hypothetical protein n=1 Tax=Nonomuraea sp. NPDC052116 TaxID=3155665 RepID=UPI00344506BD
MAAEICDEEDPPSEASGMAQSWTQIITPLIAVLGTLLGVLVGDRMNRRSQRHHWSRQVQQEACDQVFRESSRLMIDLVGLIGAKSKPTTKSKELDWNPWSNALGSLNTSVHQEIVDAAHAVDTEIWRAHRQIDVGLPALEMWFSLRDQIDLKRLDFVNAVRKHVTGQEPLKRLGGRPAREDPIWRLGETGSIEEGPAESSESRNRFEQSQPGGLGAVQGIPGRVE